MEKSTEFVLHMLDDYLAEKELDADSKFFDLMEWSYRKWTIQEIIFCLKKNPDIPPLVTVEKFADKIAKYATNHKASCLFSIIYSETQKIIDLMSS